MKCPRCGAELADDSAFCHRCGQIIGSNSEPEYADSTRVVRYSGNEPTEVSRPAAGDGTRVARRREETVLPGETTLLDAPEDPDPADDRGLDGDGLDVEVPPSHYESAAPAPAPVLDDPDAGMPNRRSKRPYVFAAIAAVVVAAVAIAFVSWRLELWGGVSVPDVMGMSEAEATATLTEAGFEVEVSSVVVDDGAGTVVSMQPQAGRRIALGRTVELGIGILRLVPDVEGLPLEEARAKLSAAGIDQLRLEYQNASDPKGTVIAVSPVAGTKVSAEDVVTLVVAQPYTVPDVIGLAEQAALAALERAGLTGSVSYVPSEDVEAGRVVSTDPAAGTELREGQSVDVSVSSPYPQSAFDLAGFLRFEPEDVSSFLQDAGFAVSYAKETDGELSMAWTAGFGGAEDEADDLRIEAIGFSPLPFSIPRGFQLFPPNLLAEGKAPIGACLALTGTGGDFEPTQDSITKVMNACGLRSDSQTTTTSSGEGDETTAHEGATYVAKASQMGESTWYVVIWRDATEGTASGARAMVGMEKTSDLERELADAGIDVEGYDGSLADVAAALVLQGAGIA